MGLFHQQHHLNIFTVLSLKTHKRHENLRLGSTFVSFIGNGATGEQRISGLDHFLPLFSGFVEKVFDKIVKGGHASRELKPSSGRQDDEFRDVFGVVVAFIDCKMENDKLW